jgi:hypothetical protein
MWYRSPLSSSKISLRRADPLYVIDLLHVAPLSRSAIFEPEDHRCHTAPELRLQPSRLPGVAVSSMPSNSSMLLGFKIADSK